MRNWSPQLAGHWSWSTSSPWETLMPELAQTMTPSKTALDTSALANE